MLKMQFISTQPGSRKTPAQHNALIAAMMRSFVSQLPIANTLHGGKLLITTRILRKDLMDFYCRRASRIVRSGVTLIGAMARFAMQTWTASLAVAGPSSPSPTIAAFHKLGSIVPAETPLESTRNINQKRMALMSNLPRCCRTEKKARKNLRKKRLLSMLKIVPAMLAIQT